MRILLVGFGKMGQLVGSLVAEYGGDLAGVIDPPSKAHGGGPDDPKWNGVDVAIDFTTPDSVMQNAPVLARRRAFFEVEPPALHRRDEALIAREAEGAGASALLKAALAVNPAGLAHETKPDRAAARRLLAAEALQVGEVIGLAYLASAAPVRAMF